MNNPNPFLPQGAFLEQKNRARTRLKIVVYFSISLSVMVLMVLLIQGCKKPNDTVETTDATTNAETSTSMTQLPTNLPPEMSAPSNTAMTPPPETNQQPVYTPPPPPPAPPAPPIAAGEDYTIVKGDTLDSIHKNYKVSVRAILDANPGLDPKRLRIGQKIHIPAAAAAPTAMTSTSGGTADAGGEVRNGATYKVKSGDTLTGIAKKLHVTIKAIQSENHLTTTSIKVGQVLKIPGGAAPAPAPAPVPVETLPPPSLTPPAPATSAPPVAH